MKPLMIVLTLLALALWPTTALASCTTTTVILDGQIRVCTVCSYPGGTSTVSCF